MPKATDNAHAKQWAFFMPIPIVFLNARIWCTKI